jgi:hypothetical protein
VVESSNLRFKNILSLTSFEESKRDMNSSANDATRSVWEEAKDTLGVIEHMTQCVI